MVIDGLDLILVDVTHALLLMNNVINEPSGYVMSSGHHDLDLVLKLPNIIVKDGLSPLTKLSRFSKFNKNSSDSIVD